MRRGLFIGRFQPLHKGHLDAIHQALKKVDILYIIIGSAQRKWDPRHCFSFLERKKMLSSSIRSKRVRILGIKDHDSDARWLAEVMRKARPEVVFSSNALVRRLFLQEGVRVMPCEMRHKVHGTSIRSKIISGKDFSADVPFSVLKMITPAVVKRLQKLYKRH